MSEQVYCKYCGTSAPNARSLTANACIRHPDGPGRGKHALYQGDTTGEYVCEFCGKTFPNIKSMTANMCIRHPDGPGKGRHSPAL